MAGEPLSVHDPGVRDRRWAIGIRTNRYLYVDLATGEEELYDLRTDPDQYHNLTARAAYADVRDMLREQLRLVRACDGAVCRTPLPPKAAVVTGGVRALSGSQAHDPRPPSLRGPAQ